MRRNTKPTVTGVWKRRFRPGLAQGGLAPSAITFRGKWAQTSHFLHMKYSLISSRELREISREVVTLKNGYRRFRFFRAARAGNGKSHCFKATRAGNESGSFLEVFLRLVTSNFYAVVFLLEQREKSPHIKPSLKY